MKVYLLSQNYSPSKHLGGIGVVVRDLPHGLSARGNEVPVIARAEDSTPEREERDRCSEDPLLADRPPPGRPPERPRWAKAAS